MNENGTIRDHFLQSYNLKQGFGEGGEKLRTKGRKDKFEHNDLLARSDETLISKKRKILSSNKGCQWEKDKPHI